jgi:ribosomal protein S18 acetylase RimI-like enzyme
MAFRKVIRKSEELDVDFADRFTVLPWTEDKTEDIAQFMLGTGTQSFAELEECADGTPASARHYVTRARTYMQGTPDAALGYAASSLVYDTTTSKLVAVCLCCGASVYFVEVHPDFQRQGLATKMLKRAVTVCAQHGVKEFHLWRCDDTTEAKLYEKLGFQWTEETE